jgi:hypothetical protein
MTAPAYLGLLASQDKTLPATVLAIGQPRELPSRLLLPTAFAHRQAVANALVLDPVEALPSQVGSHEGKRRPRPSRNLSDRKTAAEQLSNLVHKRYLKRKQ